LKNGPHLISRPDLKGSNLPKRIVENVSVKHKGHKGMVSEEKSADPGEIKYQQRYTPQGIQPCGVVINNE
jgi:hypothetical protein